MLSKSYSGADRSEMLRENFPSWFTIPKILWSSVTFLGSGMSLMADIFAGSWEIPFWLIRWPRKVSDDLETHIWWG